MTSVTRTCLARAHVGGIKNIRFENGGQIVPANQIITDFGGLRASGNTLYRLPHTMRDAIFLVRALRRFQEEETERRRVAHARQTVFVSHPDTMCGAHVLCTMEAWC